MKAFIVIIKDRHCNDQFIGYMSLQKALICARAEAEKRAANYNNTLDILFDGDGAVFKYCDHLYYSATYSEDIGEVIVVSIEILMEPKPEPIFAR